MNDINPEHWLTKMPWLSRDEAAELLACHRASVSRAVTASYDDARIDHHKAGRLLPPRDRMWLTSIGIDHQFPQTHGHSRGDLGHVYRHSDLFPDDWDHQHPRRCITETNLRSLSQRLEVAEAFYGIAPGLSKDDVGREWLGQGSELRLEDWHWLGGSGLVDAVAAYSGRVHIGFCWVGKQLRMPLMVKKWARRFADKRLECRSLVEEESPDLWANPPDSDWDPTPHLSGYVIMCADVLALHEAYRHLPKGDYGGSNAFLFATPGRKGVRYTEGQVHSRVDLVVDRFADHSVGRPGTGPLGKFWDVMNGVLPTRILGLIEEWDALTLEDIRGRCPQATRSMVKDCLRDFLSVGIAIERDGCYYLGEGGSLYVARRDGISPATVRKRGRAYLDQDSNRHAHQLSHNQGVNAVVKALGKAGIRTFGGWRSAIDIPDVTKLVPDAVMLAHVVGQSPELMFVEYETTAKSPSQVERKSTPYIEAAAAGHPNPVVFVCGTSKAERLFEAYWRNAARKLAPLKLPTLLTTTLDDVLTGSLTGEDTVWRMGGHAVPVYRW